MPRLRGGFKKLDPSRILRDKMMPRRSASAHSGRCGESGLTLMAVALPPRLDVRESYGRHLGTREIQDTAVRGNGKRATKAERANLRVSHTVWRPM
jgi:hypothetical protein